MNVVLDLVLLAACLVAVVLGDLRWFRVAQREHYIPGSASRFAGRWWWKSGPANRALAVLAFVGFAFASVLPVASILAAIALAVGPLGLGVRGRTSKLVFTSRMRRVAIYTAALQIVMIGFYTFAVGMHAASFAAVMIALLSPTIVDIALYTLAPVEMMKMKPFIDSASKRLMSVNPKVVAVTGSFGKTTAKNYLAALLSQSFTVLATPASFNNRAGLSRAINENLTPGTDVFIAEMGTYGRGEIRELCDFCPPNIAVLTAIGPVHLERFKSEENVIKAKSEIFEKASVGVLNIDDQRIDSLASSLAEQGKKVWRCSTQDEYADVCVRSTEQGLEVFAGGQQLFDAGESDAIPGNVAVAIAVAFEMGLSVDQIEQGLQALPQVPHRGSVQEGSHGQLVIDDTFNANPSSVHRSIELMGQLGGERRVLVTPGMVELGPRQDHENFVFAQNAAGVATDVLIVGRTNRRPLLAGVRSTGVEAKTVATLPEAVAWVRENTKAGDVVAYVNDLPDHFP